MKHSMLGVTLIELMIVVVVMSILAAVAVPSYRNYMMRANRTDATVALLRIRAAEEKFFLQNNRYTDDFGPAGLRMLPASSKTLTTENGYYNVSIALTATPPGFTVTAQATGGQTKDTNCTSFTINDQGVRTTSPGSLTTCWK